jgi:8-oxo-dGTP pyrophosphatase MutT (NUDIX family)
MAAPPVFPVSVKGVLLIDGAVVLLKNERDEWELPGGRLEAGEDPATCVMREIQEELGLDVKVVGIVDCWNLEVLPGKEVVIVTYGCHLDGHDEIEISAEHKEVGLFSPDALADLPMPDGYRRSVRTLRSLRDKKHLTDSDPGRL